MLRLAWFASILGLFAACSDESPSRLREREATAEVATPQPASAGEAVKSAPASEGKAAEKAGPKPPPPPSERVEIHLALKEGTNYRVTTVGNVRFGSLVQPTGFAREERLSLSDCDGEGSTRVCTLEHRYVNYEAEPPSGRLLEADEALVNKLVTRHRLLGSGERKGETTVTGPKDQADSAAGKALSEVNRFFCILFPEEPIGVGAQWRSKCHMRTGGVVDTRTVMFELTKLDKDPDMGTRAEIAYVGEYTAPGAKGPVQGVVKGTLFFMVEAGEPHLIREEFTTATDSAAKFVTHTSVAYQFAKLVAGPDGKETAVRVDGKPFPAGQALNEPKPEPAGEDTKADAKAEAKANPGG